MFIYLTGDIDSSSAFDTFMKVEKELRYEHNRVNNLVNIPTKDYRKLRVKSVLNAEKVIFIGDESIDTEIEKTIANYLDIPIEIYHDKD